MTKPCGNWCTRRLLAGLATAILLALCVLWAIAYNEGTDAFLCFTWMMLCLAGTVLAAGYASGGNNVLVRTYIENAWHRGSVFSGVSILLSIMAPILVGSGQVTIFCLLFLCPWAFVMGTVAGAVQSHWHRKNGVHDERKD